MTSSANLSLGGSASPGDLEFENIFGDRGVSWLIIDEMFALELETYRRCFPAQPVLSALQRYNRRKCAHLLRDLAATADLPPHRALFSQQLLDPTHKRWTEREDNDIDIVDILPLAAAVFFLSKLHSARYPGPFPNQFPDPQRPARPPADLLTAILLTAIAALLARRQPHNAPLLRPAWTIQEVVTEEYPVLRSVNYELGTHTPAAWIQVSKQRLSLWCQQPSQLSQRPLLSLIPPDVLARGAQDIADVHVLEQPFTVDSRPSHVGGSAWFLSCAFWICLQVAGSLLEVTQRWLVLYGTRLPGPSPVFCTSAPLVVFVLSPSVSQAVIRVSHAV